MNVDDEWAPTPPHDVSARILLEAADTLRTAAGIYLGKSADDVSDGERTRLRRAAELVSEALNELS